MNEEQRVMVVGLFRNVVFFLQTTTSGTVRAHRCHGRHRGLSEVGLTHCWRLVRAFS